MARKYNRTLSIGFLKGQERFQIVCCGITDLFNSWSPMTSK